MPNDSTKGGSYLSPEGGLTELYTRTENYVMEPTLSEFERRLSFSSFRRTSRHRSDELSGSRTGQTRDIAGGPFRAH